MWLFRKNPPPPPPPEFEQPWREMKWDQKHDLEEQLKKFKPNKPDVQQVRILLIGPVGAGKSSFINSVNNVFQHRITSEADVGTADTSFTTVYKTHYIEGKDGKPLPFVFNDTMGFEEKKRRVREQDIIRALQGFLPEGYDFVEEYNNVSLNVPKYRSNPELKDKTLCLVYVLPADNVSLMDFVIDQMKFVHRHASKLNIPQVIIMTKPDEACPLVKKDLRKIYTSKKIKEKMQLCSNLVGVPMNHIFPVKNYHDEMDVKDDIDVLILKALDHIVTIANDALKKIKKST